MGALVLAAVLLGPGLLVLSLVLRVAIALGWRRSADRPWVLCCVGLALCLFDVVAFAIVVDHVGGG